jgi:uncharacterized protein DUF2786/SprT-like family protein
MSVGPAQQSLPLADPAATVSPPPATVVEPLTAELEAALLHELAALYDVENWARFSSRLRRPVLALSDSTSRLGCWIRATRTIELSRPLVLDRPWLEVVAVLQHEMAHQLVDEVLRIGGETAHGETFRRICAELGVDGRAVGGTLTPAAGSPEIDRVLQRVRKLLALASSANRHEAESAMQRAHELMLRYNVDAAAAAEARDFETRQVGDPSRRGTGVEAAIVVLLTECFFVEAIRVPVYLPRAGKRGAVYELSGTRANLELAVHVYHFLLATADRLWQATRDGGAIRSGRDRLAYQTGVIRGFHDKLQEERTVLAGTGLVWRGDAGLDSFFHRRHPRIRSQRGTTQLNQAHLAGREDGRRVVLHRPVETGPSGARRLLRSGD